MKTLQLSLIASPIGTSAGLCAWIFGLGQIMWPAHPQMASRLLTLLTTIVIQITWPRLTETNPPGTLIDQASLSAPIDRRLLSFPTRLLGKLMVLELRSLAV
jgi:hypothetical protein